MIDESGGYRCENCQRNYEEAVPTYNFSIKISDASGAMTASILGEMGDHIMEMPCKQFYDIHQDLEALKNLRSSQCFKHFNVTLRAKAASRVGDEMATRMRALDGKELLDLASQALHCRNPRRRHG